VLVSRHCRGSDWKKPRNTSIRTVLKECILLYVSTIYMWVFSCQTQQKQTSNNSCQFHYAYLSLFGCTALLHVSAHGAIIRRYIDKSYTIELCFLYGSIYCVFLWCVTNKVIIYCASLTFTIHHYMHKLSGSVLNLDLFKMYKTSI
jgi:hypothetical protein